MFVKHDCGLEFRKLIISFMFVLAQQLFHNDMGHVLRYLNVALPRKLRMVKAHTYWLVYWVHHTSSIALYRLAFICDMKAFLCVGKTATKFNSAF